MRSCFTTGEGPATTEEVDKAPNNHPTEETSCDSGVAYASVIKTLILRFGTKPILSSLALSSRYGKKCEYKSCGYEEIKATVQGRTLSYLYTILQ